MQIKNVFTIIFACYLCSGFAQQAWQLESSTLASAALQKNIQQFQIARLDASVLQTQLQAAPQEFLGNFQRIQLPLPDGSLQAFDIANSPIMEAGLAQKYPHFQTYAGYAVANKSMSMRCGWTSQGFHAFMLSSEGDIYILPTEKEDLYIIYYGKHEIGGTKPEHMCGFAGMETQSYKNDTSYEALQSGDQLRLIRTAIATTGEYTEERANGNIENGLASVVRITNNMNAIFERDVAARLLLVDDNDRLIYPNPNTDPYDIDAFRMLQQNVENINQVIGRENYDLGHVLAFNIEGGVGGVASFVGNFCTQQAAAGVSAFFDNEARLVRTTAHEIGHQLGADHTWSNCGEDLNETQRSSNTSVEPGSGTTIMSYAGACAENDVADRAYPFFHGISIRQMNSRLDDASTCYRIMETGNTEPIVRVDSPNGLWIPISTPFELIATATDVDGDELTYSWEQFDTGPISELGIPMGNTPTFRAFQPTTLPARVLPQRITIQFNREDDTEVLPTYTRNFLFNIVVRDNRSGGGGVVLKPSNFSATETSGPFTVLSPNSEDTVWSEGQEVEVTWDVADTDMAPVNCDAVDILLSYNNGFSYLDTLAHAVPNNGSAIVSVPIGRTNNRCRLKVKATNNIFFDISNSFFPVVEGMVATDETLVNNKLKVLPNPAKDKLWIALEDGTNAPLQLRLYDMRGHVLKQLQSTNLSNTQTLDVSDVPAGVYYLKGVQAGKSYVQKVVIQ